MVRLAVTLAVSAAVLGAAGAARSQEAGFGGAPLEERRAPETSAAPSECLVQDEAGAWVSCDLVLERAPEPERVAPRPAEPPSTGRASTEPERFEPKVEPSSRPVRMGPFDKALAEVRKGKKTPPLVELRRRVEALAADVDAIKADPARVEERDEREREHAFLAGVLRHVEGEAFERMRKCLRRHRLPVPEPMKTYRMTPAGPVPLTPEELRSRGPAIEKYPCERVRVTDEELIAKITRLHEIEERLEREDFGWARRDEKAALEKERRALVDEIDGDDPLRHYRPKYR